MFGQKPVFFLCIKLQIVDQNFIEFRLNLRSVLFVCHTLQHNTENRFIICNKI